MSMSCGCAAGGSPCHCHDAVPLLTESAEHLVVTINPEARVSVVRPAASVFTVSGGELELTIGIINEGGVTGFLRTKLVGSVPGWVTLEADAEPLTGAPREQQRARLVFSEPRMADLTIAFALPGESPDLGGRDRVSFLVRDFFSLPH